MLDFAVVLIGKFSDTLKNNINELEVQRLRHFFVERLLFDPVRWLFNHNPEILKKALFKQESMEGVNDASCDSKPNTGAEHEEIREWF